MACISEESYTAAAASRYRRHGRRAPPSTSHASATSLQPLQQQRCDVLVDSSDPRRVTLWSTEAEVGGARRACVTATPTACVTQNADISAATCQIPVRWLVRSWLRTLQSSAINLGSWGITCPIAQGRQCAQPIMRALYARITLGWGS